MSAATSTSKGIMVAPASTPDHWHSGRALVTEMVAWLSSAAGLDARAEQHDSDEELDALEAFYREPNGMLLIGFLHGRACGTTGVHLMSPQVAELRRVWVTPEARGHGLASLLLRSGIDAARSLGATSVWLETLSGAMDTAIGMYTRAGFQPIVPYSTLSESNPEVLTLGLTLS